MSESVRHRDSHLFAVIVDGSLLTIKLIRKNSTHFDVKTTGEISSKLTILKLNRVS